MATIVLNSATPLNGAALLVWTITDSNNKILTNPAPVAGYITLFDTVKNSVSYISLSPDELAPPVNPDQTTSAADVRNLSNVKYTLKGLTNGTLYVVSVNLYSGSLENNVASGSEQVTPSTVPVAPLLKDYSVVSTISTGSASITVNTVVPSSNGLPIDFLNLFLSDTVTYTPVEYTFVSQSFSNNASALTAAGLAVGTNRCYALPSNINAGETLSLTLPSVSSAGSTNYVLYAEAVNAAGASLPSNVLSINTLNIPSPLTVTSVVSGLDSKVTVNLAAGANASQFALSEVTIQYWELPSSGSTSGAVASIIRTTTAFTGVDTFGNLKLTGLDVTGLTNGKVYVFAAYGKNAYGTGIKASSIASTNAAPTLQGPFKTAVPAKLPSLSEFVGYGVNSTSSTAGTSNSLLALVASANTQSAYATPDGKLGAVYKAANLPAYTYAASTSYEFTFFDQNGVNKGSKTVTTIYASATTGNWTAANGLILDELDTKYGSYSASVVVRTEVAAPVAPYFGALPAPLSFTVSPVQISQAPRSAPRNGIANGYRSTFATTPAADGNALYYAVAADLVGRNPLSAGVITAADAAKIVAQFKVAGATPPTTYINTGTNGTATDYTSATTSGVHTTINGYITSFLGAKTHADITLPVAAVGNTYGIELSWQPPAEDGNSKIVGYKVELNSATGTLLWRQYTTSTYQFINAVAATQSAPADFPSAAVALSGSGTTASNFGSWSSLALDTAYSAVITAYNKEGASVKTLTISNIYVNNTAAPVASVAVSVAPATATPDALAPDSLRPFNVTWNAPANVPASLTLTGYSISIFDVNNNLISSGSQSGSANISYKIKVPVTLQKFTVGVKAVYRDLNNSIQSSVFVYSSLTTNSSAPSITIGQNAFQTDSAGNGVIYFTVNNDGSGLTGLTVFVVPDSSVAASENPTETLALASNVVKTPTIIDPVNGNIATYQVSLGYKIPANPGFLIVAANSVGSSFLARNLA